MKAEDIFHSALEEAEALQRETLELMRQRTGPESRETASALTALGKCLLLQEKFVESESLLRTAVALWEKGAPDDPILFHRVASLASPWPGKKSSRRPSRSSSRVTGA